MPVRPFLKRCGCHCNIERVVPRFLASLPLTAPPTKHMLKECKLIQSRIGASVGLMRVLNCSCLIVMQSASSDLATWWRGHEAPFAGGGVYHGTEVLGRMVPLLLWGMGPHFLQVLLHVHGMYIENNGSV